MVLLAVPLFIKTAVPQMAAPHGTMIVVHQADTSLALHICLCLIIVSLPMGPWAVNRPVLAGVRSVPIVS